MLNGSIHEFKTEHFEEIAGVQIAVEVIQREVRKIVKNEPGQEERGIELLEIANSTISEIYGGYRFLREEYPLILEWMVLAEQTNEEMTSPDDAVSGAIEEDECEEMILVADVFLFSAVEWMRDKKCHCTLLLCVFNQFFSILICLRNN